MAVLKTLAELDMEVEKDFDRECKYAARVARQYIAGNKGCGSSDVILPEDFTEKLYMVENGVGRLFGPYLAKRVDDSFVVLVDGRRFCAQEFTEIIWEHDEIDEEDEWERDDYNDFMSIYGGGNVENIPAYGPTFERFKDCSVVPYTKKLQQTMSWRSDKAALIERNTQLHKYYSRDAFIKKTLKYIHYAIVTGLVVMLVWLLLKMFIK